MESRFQRQQREVGHGVLDGDDTYRQGYTLQTTSASNDEYEMKVYDFVVEVVAVASYPITVYLPPVAEARGKIYTIFASAHGESSCSITVADAKVPDDPIFNDGNSAGGGGTHVTLAYVNNYAVLFSNGVRWFLLASHTAS